MKKLIRSIIPVAMLSITLLFIIIAGFSWYVSNQEVKATGVTGSTAIEEDKLTITFEDKTFNVLPGELTLMVISFEAPEKTSAKLNFEATEGIKELNYVEATEFRYDEIYYTKSGDGDEATYQIAENLTAFDSNTKYYIKNVKTEILDGETSNIVNTPLEKLYGVDSYYSSNNNPSSKYLTMVEKANAFDTIYNNASSYLISNKMKICVKDKTIDERQYMSEIESIPTNSNWATIPNLNYHFSISDSDYDSEKKVFKKELYIYLYFDPTDEYFEINENTFFYGQNPYFFKNFKLKAKVFG